MKTATIWTASSCQHDPGTGAYAVTITLPDGTTSTKSNGRRITTPRRMQLYAAIRGLTALDPGHHITLRTSSKYLVNGINARAYDSNTDLWTRLSEAASKHGPIRAAWCTPTNDPTAGETQAQADRTSTQRHRKADTGYENNSGFRA